MGNLPYPTADVIERQLVFGRILLICSRYPK